MTAFAVIFSFSNISSPNPCVNFVTFIKNNVTYSILNSLPCIVMQTEQTAFIQDQYGYYLFNDHNDIIKISRDLKLLKDIPEELPDTDPFCLNLIKTNGRRCFKLIGDAQKILSNLIHIGLGAEGFVALTITGEKPIFGNLDLFNAKETDTEIRITCNPIL